MRPRDRLTFYFIAAIALLGGIGVEANPLKDPRRMVNEQTVDLSPLFRWWPKREGTRPLRAWVHVHGPLVGTNYLGWIVQAQVEQAPGESKPAGAVAASDSGKIILRHPPLRELTEFQQWSTNLESLLNQRARFSSQANNAESKLREYRAKAKTVHGRVPANVVRELKKEQALAQAEGRALEPQIKACRTKLAAFPDASKYIADVFAFKTGQAYNGLAVYDYGVAP